MSKSQKAKTGIQDISLDDILLDPQNPRLPKIVGEQGEPAIAEWLVKNADVLELMQSIGSQGYFRGEPILVTAEGAPEGKFFVIEGNCRLAACKLLQNPSFIERRRRSIEDAAETAEFKPLALPCVEYATRREVLGYLGYRHVTGVHAWDALQKARYLDQLREVMIDSGVGDGELLKRLAKDIGSRSDYVAKLLTGLKLYENIVETDFFGLKGMDEDDVSFSLLTTSLSYRDICTFLGLEGPGDEKSEALNLPNLKHLMEWLFLKGSSDNRTRLGESRNLKALAAVVSHDEALSRFVEGMSLDEATEWTHLPDETYRAAIEAALSALRRGRSVMHQVNQTTETDLKKLHDIHGLAKDLHTLAKTKLTAGDELEDF